MKNNGSNKKTAKESQNNVDRGFLAALRPLTIIAVAAGAVASFALTLRAGRSSPRLLLILFVIWVLSPFVALAWANVVSTRWSILTRATLYCASLIITLASLAIYGNIVSPPAGSPHAFVFVAVPPGSWLLAAIAVSLAALISRRRSG